MTMEYLNCAPAEAYEALVAEAAATRLDVRSIALDVVERRLRFGD